MARGASLRNVDLFTANRGFCVSTPLLIGLIWLGLLAVFTGVLRVGTSSPTPRPSLSPPLAVTDRAPAARQERWPKQSPRLAVAARVEAA